MNALRSVLVAYLLTGVFFTTPAISGSLHNETSDTVKTINGPQNLKSVGKSQFIPIFGDGKGKLARRQLDDFDRAVLKTCGTWGSKVERSALVALFNDPNLESYVRKIYDSTNHSTAGNKSVDIKSFTVDMVDMLYSGGIFQHVFCGNPEYKEDGRPELGGLHYDARTAELQDQGLVGGLSQIDCERSSSNHPVYTIGMDFLMPDMRSVGRKCPGGFVSQSAVGLIIAITKANKEASASGRTVCLSTAVMDNKEVSFLFVRDATTGSPKTFYDNDMQACERWGENKEDCVPCNVPVSSKKN